MKGSEGQKIRAKVREKKRKRDREKEGTNKRQELVTKYK